jgi:hypothetical protein
MNAVSAMTWKSTALLTGATTLAAWLAAPPPARTARSSEGGATSKAFVTSAIEAEAARLSARLRPQAALSTPERNPFRFESPRVAAPVRRTPEAAPVAAAAEAVASLPEWPAIRLTGVATDVVAGASERTAIFSGPEGVLLVREGETVLNRYRVTRINEEAVDVTRLADGVSRRISLSPAPEALSPKP